MHEHDQRDTDQTGDQSRPNGQMAADQGRLQQTSGCRQQSPRGTAYPTARGGWVVGDGWRVVAGGDGWPG